jgi:hypothetical protein
MKNVKKSLVILLLALTPHCAVAMYEPGYNFSAEDKVRAIEASGVKNPQKLEPLFRVNTRLGFLAEARSYADREESLSGMRWIAYWYSLDVARRIAEHIIHDGEILEEVTDGLQKMKGVGDGVEKLKSAEKKKGKKHAV